MVFMILYHDITTNDSHIFLNFTIMCVFLSRENEEKKQKSFFSN